MPVRLFGFRVCVCPNTNAFTHARSFRIGHIAELSARPPYFPLLPRSSCSGWWTHTTAGFVLRASSAREPLQLETRRLPRRPSFL